ncbi:MAG: hypothetical protein G8345_19740, partial [Magnetococcales bacterium]|nr:hypothetical protein [Magnetococcales bacterium]
MDAFPVQGLGIEVAEQVPLAPFTTWRIGGKARWLVQPQSGEQLAQVMLATRHLPRLLLGGGSNLLLADEGFDGVVVRLGKGLEEISLVSPTL